MRVFSVIALTSAFEAARACTRCPHPGTFEGNVSLFANPAGGRCGLEDTPPGANYAAVPAQFFDPPDEAPCDEPLNVTNPATGQLITAIVVGQFTTTDTEDLQLSGQGLAALGYNSNVSDGSQPVIWTFQ